MNRYVFEFLFVLFVCNPVFAQTELLRADDPATGMTFLSTEALRRFKPIQTGIVLPKEKGCAVDRVAKGSPADVAGIEPLDYIVEIGGKAITDYEEYKKASSSWKLGQPLSITLIRPDKNLKRFTWKKKISGQITTVASIEVAPRFMRFDRDEVEGETWVSHEDSNKNRHTCGRANSYFQLDNGKATNFRMVFSLLSQRAFIAESIFLSAGDKKRDFKLKPFEADYEFRVEEKSATWVDRRVDEEMWKLLCAFVGNEGGTIRFKSSSNYLDVDFTLPESIGLRDTLLAYLALGGEVPGAEGVKRNNIVPSTKVSSKDNFLGTPVQLVENPLDEGKVNKNDEDKAQNVLKQAKKLIGVNDSAAQRRLKELIEKYPETDAADEAEEILNKILDRD